MNIEDHVQIDELLRLAKRKTDRSRHLLVENISDLFLSPDGRLSDHERALMSDILCKLVEGVEARVRKELAKRLTTVEDVPADLIRLLANDEISIARPILERSTVLRNPDLIEIIRHRSKEHRMAIALRREVPPEVGEALIEYGDVDIVEALLNNPDAELSERSMEYLVAESHRVDRFQEPLLFNHDLPPRLAHQMFWWVSAALRHHILDTYTAAEYELDDAIEFATMRAITDHKPSISIESRAYRLVRRLLQSGDLTIMFLIQALRQQRIPVFIAGAAELGGIDYRTSANIFMDSGGECLAVLGKGIGMERNDFTTVFLLLEHSRDTGQPTDPGSLKRNLDLFDSITKDNAKTALKYWRRGSDYLTAIDDVEKA